MKITPIDIRKHSFKKKLFGYDTEAVDSFLFLVAEEVERLIKEREELKEKANRQETRLENYSEREKILKETLYNAQKTADERKKNAEKEAENIIAEAEYKAEKIIDRAQDQVASIEEDIQDLKLERYRLKEDIKSILDKYEKFLEVMEDRGDEREKIEFFTDGGS